MINKLSVYTGALSYLTYYLIIDEGTILKHLYLCINNTKCQIQIIKIHLVHFVRMSR